MKLSMMANIAGSGCGLLSLVVRLLASRSPHHLSGPRTVVCACAPEAATLSSRDKASMAPTPSMAKAPLLRPSNEEWADPVAYMQSVRDVVEQCAALSTAGSRPAGVHEAEGSL